MRVQTQIDVSAPPEAVWAYIADPARYLHYMAGITRWQVQGDQAQGMGARYRMLMRIGSAEVGGLVEVVEFTEPFDLAWNSVTGVDQRGRWRVRARPRGRTHVEFRLSYGVAGAGLGGYLAEQFSAPMVRSNLRRSLQQLKRQVEHEQLRNAAAREPASSVVTRKFGRSLRRAPSFVGADDGAACAGGTGKPVAGSTRGGAPAGCQRTSESGH